MENVYKITPEVLYEMINYAVDHPEKHFCADELTDSAGDFLSCFFYVMMKTVILFGNLKVYKTNIKGRRFYENLQII